MFYQNRAFVVAVVICCFRKTVVPSPRFVLIWKVAVYNAKSSARCSIIASTTPICMYFQANDILLELRFRNFPNEHSTRVYASFYRISLKSAFSFVRRNLWRHTNKSKGFIKRIFKLKFHEEKWRGFPFVHSERVRNDLHRYIFLAKRYFPTP